MQEDLKDPRSRNNRPGREAYWRLAQSLEPSLTMQGAVSESSGFRKRRGDSRFTLRTHNEWSGKIDRLG